MRPNTLIERRRLYLLARAVVARHYRRELTLAVVARALAAPGRLLPLNAPGSARGDLPPPVYCPGLHGEIDAELQRVLASLPSRACKQAGAASALAGALVRPTA